MVVMKIQLIAILVISTLSAGCGLKQMTTRTVGAISFDGAAVLEAEQDVELARDNTIPLIKSMEVLLAGDEHDRRYLTLLAKAYGQYAFGFYEEDLIRYQGRDEKAYGTSRRRADMFYDRGTRYGKRALATKGKMREALSSPVPRMEKELAKWGEKDVPTLFWAAFSWGNWVNLHRDEPTAIVDMPRIQAIVERVVKLDPAYNYGAALSFLGAIHAIRPSMLGGDPERAREYFNRAMDIAPNYLMNKVMAAQFLAVQVQDRTLFIKLLRGVLACDAAALPEQRLANELAQRRAALLLERVDEYF